MHFFGKGQHSKIIRIPPKEKRRGGRNFIPFMVARKKGAFAVAQAAGRRGEKMMPIHGK